jgi:putative hydrolase of the HAD superfamily
MNIVFDFGAVLFTWRPLELVAAAFPELAGTPQSANDFAHSVFAHPDWMDFDRGRIDRTRVAELTAQRLGLDLPRVTALVDSVEEKLIPLPDTLAVLREIYTLKQQTHSVANSAVNGGVGGLYFLSNMSEPFSRMLEQTYDFLQWFDGGIFSGDVQLIKPEPAIYEMLQTRYSLDPASIVFIDDMPYNVEAARALGWHAIHFTSATQLRAELAQHISL